MHVYCRYGVKHNPNQSIINTCTKHVKLKTEKVQRCASMISTEHDEKKVARQFVIILDYVITLKIQMSHACGRTYMNTS